MIRESGTWCGTHQRGRISVLPAADPGTDRVDLSPEAVSEFRTLADELREALRQRVCQIVEGYWRGAAATAISRDAAQAIIEDIEVVAESRSG